MTRHALPYMVPLLAQITRNELAVAYWQGVLLDCKDSAYYATPAIRRATDRCLKLCTRYEAALNTCFVNLEGLEKVKDASYHLRKHLKQQFFYYEQAVQRLLHLYKYPDVAFLSRLSASKDLLDFCQAIGVLEYCTFPHVKPLLQLPCMPADHGYMKVAEDLKNEPKSTLGYLTRAAVDHNHTIRIAMGLDDIRYNLNEGDAEIVRAMEISSCNIFNDMTNYDIIYTLYTDPGKTWEEAAAIVKEIKDNEPNTDKNGK